MKSFFSTVAMLTLTFPVFAQADCASHRTRLAGDVNSAIHTYPASCRGMIHLKCAILLNNRLPALLHQLQADTPEARANMLKIAKGVNERRAELVTIIDTPYLGQLNNIVNGLNLYVRKCTR